MKKVFLTLGLVCAAMGVSALTPVEPKPVAENHDTRKRAREIAARRAEGHVPVVFVGGMRTEFFMRNGGGSSQWDKYFAPPPYRALNLGYAGDAVEHTLWRIEHGLLDGLSPKAIVYAPHWTITRGRWNETAAAAADVRAILDALRTAAPKAKIVLCCLFPCGRDNNGIDRKASRNLNAVIKNFADGENILWVDCYEQFLMPDGILSREVMPTYVHFYPYAYEVWSNALIPALNQILKN